MTEGNSRGNKVERVIERWNLPDLGDELERRWLGHGRDDHSLRELTEYFNKKILTEALTESGTVPLEGEIENFYELLTSEDVTKSDTLQAEQRLTQMGVNPDELSEDFISHQTMYRYLKNARNVQKQREQQPIEDVIETSRRTSIRLTNRLKSVVQKNLETLNRRSGFHIGDFDVYVDIQIVCSDCGTSRNLKQILEQSGCECS